MVSKNHKIMASQKHIALFCKWHKQLLATQAQWDHSVFLCLIGRSNEQRAVGFTIVSPS